MSGTNPLTPSQETPSQLGGGCLAEEYPELGRELKRVRTGFKKRLKEVVLSMHGPSTGRSIPPLAGVGPGGAGAPGESVSPT